MLPRQSRRPVVLLRDEQSAASWTGGESETDPAVEVQGRTLACPPRAGDLEWLESLATPAPYREGVRDALQIGAEHPRLPIHRPAVAAGGYPAH